MSTHNEDYLVVQKWAFLSNDSVLYCKQKQERGGNRVHQSIHKKSVGTA